ncbi:MAG TPA: nucleotidyltransferase domain-containing protein [Thermoanaerobaculia bacterium]|nr:nucleotidyltransferase domain-containing protein [Thermoanaerobaculia bacterium]
MDSKPIETRLLDVFAAYPAEDIAAAYLFGSVARGTARRDSDVDVGILYSTDPPSGLAGLGLALEGELERALGRDVQVVVLNRAPVDLVHRVLRDGKLIYERDRSRRIAFEVRSRNEFFDLQPVLRRYRMFEGHGR